MVLATLEADIEILVVYVLSELQSGLQASLRKLVRACLKIKTRKEARESSDRILS